MMRRLWYRLPWVRYVLRPNKPDAMEDFLAAAKFSAFPTLKPIRRAPRTSRLWQRLRAWWRMRAGSL